jgi:hypothetical protein
MCQARAAVIAATLWFAPLHAQDGWTQDFAAAKATAVREHKDLLVVFTGSDWCQPCKRLEQEVFRSPEFLQAVPRDFVLVRLDFPRDESLIAAEVKRQNGTLQEQWQVHDYPEVFLADAVGKPYAACGYDKGGPGSWLAELTRLQAVHGARDARLRDAADKQGLERARALDLALGPIDPGILAVFYLAEVEELLRLAKDDKALTRKYTEVRDRKLLNEIQAAYHEYARDRDGEGAIRAMREFQTKYADRPAAWQKAAMLEMDATFNHLGSTRDWDGAIRAMDDFAVRWKDRPPLLQKALADKAMALLMKRERDECVKLLEAARAADPDSEFAGQLGKMIAGVKAGKG